MNQLHLPFQIAVLTLPLLLTLAACTQVPELDASIPEHLRKADYPKLKPLDKSLTTPAAPDEEATEIEEELFERRDRLKNRADQLNSPIIDPETRARMAEGVSE